MMVVNGLALRRDVAVESNGRVIARRFVATTHNVGEKHVSTPLTWWKTNMHVTK